jgi:SpoVK/Ycf46/Vps4 family AAA+-type ATPase
MPSFVDPERLRSLEREATFYSQKAVEADRKNLKSLAITYYSKAIDALTTLVDEEESPILKQIYMKKIREYRYRLVYLRGAVSSKVEDGTIHTPRIDPDDSITRPGDGEVVGREVELDWLKPFKSSITWDDIVGLDDVKRIIRQSIVYPIRRPDLFPLGWPRGVLLYGPPGCGKTSIAAAVSNEVEAEFYPVDAPMIMSKWLGEGEKRVASIFRFLRKRAENNIPTILFIDEVDSIFGVRNNEVGGEARVKNQFLKEMDGLEDKDSASIPLFVIASTNKPWHLDFAFVRRFQKRVYIPIPDFDVRKELFRFYLSKLNIAGDIDYSELARLTNGYTSSDIRDICQSAHLEVVSEFFESGHANDPNSRPRAIEMGDLREAIKRVRPSVSIELQKTYNIWHEKFSSI